MCGGPVGDNQSYWGLIQIKIAGNQMTGDQLDEFKRRLIAFLNNQAATGLPQNATAGLANGTVKTDGQDGASIQLVNTRP